MDPLNRLSRTSSLTSFSQQRRHDAEDTFDQRGSGARNPAREASAPPSARSFAGILARLVEA